METSNISDPNRVGEWPMPRHDVQLSGHSSASGEIRQPVVKWCYHLGRGRMENVVVEDVDGDGEMEVLRMGAGRLIATTVDGKEKWVSVAGGTIVTIVDLDEDGRKEIVMDGPVVVSGVDGTILWRTPTAWAPNWRTHVGKLDPGRRGLQIAAVTECQEYNSAHFFTFEDGAAQGRLIWEKEFNKGGVWAHATSTVGDIDGDGAYEVCAAVQGGVVALDVCNGDEKLRFEWEAGGQKQRNYGQCCIADVDGDGLNEIVVMDDLIALQLVVIKAENGQGRMLWSKFWGWWYPFTGHLLHFVPKSVCDVDGDGRIEIVISVYDEDWRLHLYDGTTGELKFERRNSYLESVCDVDGDGRMELLLSEQRHLTCREYSDFVVISCEEGEWKERWRRSRCRLEADSRVEYDIGMGSRSHDPKAPFITDWDGDGRGDLLVAIDDDGDAAPERFLAVGPDADGLWREKRSWQVDPEMEMKVLAVNDLDGAGRPEILAGDNRGYIQVIDSNGTVSGRWAAGGGFSAVPTVADLDGDGKNELIIQTSDGWVQAFKATGDPQKPLERRWRYRGWGTSWSGSGGEGVLAADLDGDGRKEVLVGTRTGSGNAALAALNCDGTVRWLWEVPGMAAATAYRSVHRWTVGNFNGDGVLDVYVCTRWTPFGGAGSSNESWALDGRDGSVLWHNDGKNTGFYHHHCLGPTGLPSIYDVDGDGIDDILMMSLDFCVTLNGNTGAFLQDPVSPPAIFKDGMWTAYGSIVLTDLNKDGEREQLTSANHGIWGAMTLAREPLWMVDPGPEMMATYHGGLADVDGDGEMELGVAHPGELRCYDAKTGRVKWTLEVDIKGDIVTADIDGDGVSEFIGAGSRIYAIKGESEGGKVLWSLDLDRSLSAPVVADVDGDRLAEVLVVTADGYLCAVDQQFDFASVGASEFELYHPESPGRRSQRLETE